LQVSENEFGTGIDGFAMTFSEVIENRDFMAAIEQLLHTNTADVAGAAGDENLHKNFFEPV
jgi:hypothetical protein